MLISLITALTPSIPQPPVTDAMPKLPETIFNIFIFIPLGIALALAVRKIVKGQGPVLLYCIIGGALAATMEPVVDVLGLVYLKEVNALGTFATCTPEWFRASQTPKVAPVVSVANSIRPASITSNGSVTTSPPASATLDAVSSAVGTEQIVSFVVTHDAHFDPGMEVRRDELFAMRRRSEVTGNRIRVLTR